MLDTLKRKFNLPDPSLLKIAEMALVVGVSAGLTWFVAHISGTEFGVYTPVVVFVISVLLAWLKQVAGN